MNFLQDHLSLPITINNKKRLINLGLIIIVIISSVCTWFLVEYIVYQIRNIDSLNLESINPIKPKVGAYDENAGKEKDGSTVKNETDELAENPELNAESEDINPPYTDEFSPQKNGTDIAKNTNIVLHIKDNESGVDETSIEMMVGEIIVKPDITGTSTNYVLTYNPEENFSYNQVVNVKVKANDLASNIMPMVEYSFTITSIPNNSPIFSDIKDIDINLGDSVNFKVFATDEDNDTLTYGILNLPNSALFNEENFLWTPNENQAGLHNITFTVSDGKVQVSKSVNIMVNVVDNIAPSNITDLIITKCLPNFCNLQWTAPGDNRNIGTANSYIIKYANDEINQENWNSAKQILNLPPQPQIAGSIEKFSVTGLSPNLTYYFAIKARDEAQNESGLSNAVNGSTVKTGYYMPDDCANMTDCLSLLSDGDTLIIRDGDYTGEKNKVIPWATPRPTAKEDITIKAEQPGNVTIGEGPTSISLKFTGGQASSYYKIEGIIWKMGQ